MGPLLEWIIPCHLIWGANERRVNDPGFESDESVEEGVSERKRLKYDAKATWTSAEPAVE